MKFVAERGALLAALQRCNRVAARATKTTLPIMTHLKIEARRQGVRLTANNLDREIVVDLEASVTRTGLTTAPARALVDLVNSADDGCQIEVELPSGKDRLTLRAGRPRGTFPTLPEAEYPAFKDATFAAAFEIDGDAFAAAVRSVAHAISNEETRYYLNGIYMHRRGERELVFVATDGHRLARTVLELPEDLPDIPGVIVPRQAVDDIHVLADENDRIEIAVGEDMVRVIAGGAVLTSKLVDGTFPDYERVIPPADVAEGFEVDRMALAAAARRCDIVSEAKNHSMRMVPNGSALELQSGQRDAGEIADEIDAETSTRIPIGVDPRYLMPALEALGGKQIRVRYADAGAPIAFTDPSQPHKLQIIMAKRV